MKMRLCFLPAKSPYVRCRCQISVAKKPSNMATVTMTLPRNAVARHPHLETRGLTIIPVGRQNKETFCITYMRDKWLF